ncbi:hypothetical protein BLNAU_11496 [Blattamonas nauphoetae]|uniref:TmcB/TmcC TPR repeats domain-containing protein n=1 Tax=Blattamonas nauphoetae TaxID=2049346 RepID=A0ABQ9XM63_9EUKA|nr:hypothetical protein BLNAU_11496 [Blattamonas nauphoetae]
MSLKGGADLLLQKPPLLDRITFFFIYPLFDQKPIKTHVWSFISWGLLFLELIGLAFYGVQLDNYPLLIRIFGFFDFSSFLSLFDYSIVVFPPIALLLILLSIVFIVVGALLYKNIISSSPWLLSVFRTYINVVFSVVYIPIQSILFTLIDCKEGALNINPNIACWSNGTFIGILIPSLVFFVTFALLHCYISFFIFNFDTKHGGYDSHNCSWFQGLFSLFLTMQIVVMRLTPSDRGWRSLLTLIPTGLLILATFVRLPYYHISKNCFIIYTLYVYFMVRFGLEIALFLNNSVGQLVVFVVFAVVGVLSGVALVFLLIWRHNRFQLVNKDGTLVIPIAEAEKHPDHIPKVNSPYEIEISTRYLQHKGQKVYRWESNDLEPLLPEKNPTNGKKQSIRKISMRTSDHIHMADLAYRLVIKEHSKDADLLFNYSLFLRFFKRLPTKAEDILKRTMKCTRGVVLRFQLYAYFQRLSEGTNSGEGSASDTAIFGKEGMAGGGAASMSMSNQLRTPSSKALFEDTVKFHKESRTRLKEFWANLVLPTVNYQIIPQLIVDIVINGKKAKDGYEELLHSYPNNAKVLRCFASLLTDIYHDEDAADHLTSRAEVVEDELGLDNETMSIQNPSTLSPSGGADRLSLMSDGETTSKKPKRKRKKKKGGAGKMQELEQLIDNDTSDVGSSSEKQHVASFYFPFLIVCSVLLLGCLLGGYFGLNALVDVIDNQSATMKEMNSITERVALLANYNRLALFYTHKSYDPTTFPSFIATEDEILQNLTTIAEDILERLQVVFRDPYFEAWGRQDVDVVYVSYDQLEEVSDDWVQPTSLYNAYRVGCYNSIDIGESNPTLTTTTSLSKLSMLVVNYPTTILYSHKRAIRELLDSIHLSTNILVVIIFVNETALFTIISSLLPLGAYFAFRQVDKERKKSYQLVLGVPKIQLMRLNNTLLNSENRMGELMSDDRYEQKPQNGTFTFSTAQMNAAPKVINARKGLGADGLGIPTVQEEQNEDDFEIGQVPVDVLKKHTFADIETINNSNIDVSNLVDPTKQNILIFDDAFQTSETFPVAAQLQQSGKTDWIVFQDDIIKDEFRGITEHPLELPELIRLGYEQERLQSPIPVAIEEENEEQVTEKPKKKKKKKKMASNTDEESTKASVHSNPPDDAQNKSENSQLIETLKEALVGQTQNLNPEGPDERITMDDDRNSDENGDEGERNPKKKKKKKKKKQTEQNEGGSNNDVPDDDGVLILDSSLFPLMTQSQPHLIQMEGSTDPLNMKQHQLPLMYNPFSSLANLPTMSPPPQNQPSFPQMDWSAQLAMMSPDPNLATADTPQTNKERQTSSHNTNRIAPTIKPQDGFKKTGGGQGAEEIWETSFDPVDENDDNYDSKARGELKNVIDDEPWQHSLEKAIDRAQKGNSEIPSAIPLSGYIIIVVFFLLILLIAAATSVLLLITSDTMADLASSVMLTGYRLTQGQVLHMLILQIFMGKGEIALKNTSRVMEPQHTSSSILNDFSHLSTDQDVLLDLISKFYDEFILLDDVLMKGSPATWTNDKFLAVSTRECPPNLTDYLIGTEKYQSPFDFDDRLIDGRIADYPNYYNGLQLLARFDRKMYTLLRNQTTPIDPTHSPFGFLHTSLMFDVDAYSMQYSHAFHVAELDALESFRLVTVISLATRAAVIFVFLFVSLFQVYPLMRRVGGYTSSLQQFLPDNNTDLLDFNREMETDVPNLDLPRRKICELAQLVYENVGSFGSKNETLNLMSEVMQAVKNYFHQEEEMMKEVNYHQSERSLHIADHIKIRQRLTILSEGLIDAEDPVVFASLLTLLTTFQNHFETLDQDFAKVYKEVKPDYAD